MKNQDEVRRIPISRLRKYPDHPYLILENDPDMERLVSSIRREGVLNPILVRALPGDIYEIVAGHRRVVACEQCGLGEIPAIVEECDESRAAIHMVESNLARSHITLKEQCRAMAKQVEAMRHQGARTDLTNGTCRAPTMEQIGASLGMSTETVRRRVKLARLLDGFLDMTEDKKLTLSAAEALSGMRPASQKVLLDYIQKTGCYPNPKEAEALGQAAKEKELTEEQIDAILNPAQEPVKVEKLAKRTAPASGHRLLLDASAVGTILGIPVNPDLLDDMILQVYRVLRRAAEAGLVDLSEWIEPSPAQKRDGNAQAEKAVEQGEPGAACSTKMAIKQNPGP